MRTFIIIFDSDVHERAVAEFIERKFFNLENPTALNVKNEVAKTLGIDEGFEVIPITDFMDDFNNDGILYSGSWISYVYA